MFNMIQMPPAHVRNSGSEMSGSNTATQHPADHAFSSKLTALISEINDQPSTSGMAQQVKPFYSLGPWALVENDVTEEVSDLEWLATLFTSLHHDSDDQVQAFMQSDEMKDWLTTAMQWLDGLVSTGDGDLHLPLTQQLNKATIGHHLPNRYDHSGATTVRVLLSEMINMLSSTDDLTNSHVDQAITRHVASLRNLYDQFSADMLRLAQSLQTNEGINGEQNNRLLGEVVNGSDKVWPSLQHASSTNADKTTNSTLSGQSNSNAMQVSSAMNEGVQLSEFARKWTAHLSHTSHSTRQSETDLTNSSSQSLQQNNNGNDQPQHTLTLSQAVLSDMVRPLGGEQLSKQPVYVHMQQFAEQSGPLIFKHIKLAQVNGISEARISLIPEHLGYLNIQITMKNGQMAAQFIVDNLHGKHMLEGQLTQLRQVLQEQGIQVDKLEVVQGQQSGMFQEQREYQSARHTKERSGQRKVDYNTINDEFSMDAVGENSRISHMYGGSFDAVV